MTRRSLLKLLCCLPALPLIGKLSWAKKPQITVRSGVTVPIGDVAFKYEAWTCWTVERDGKPVKHLQHYVNGKVVSEAHIEPWQMPQMHYNVFKEDQNWTA